MGGCSSFCEAFPCDSSTVGEEGVFGHRDAAYAFERVRSPEEGDWVGMWD